MLRRAMLALLCVAPLALTGCASDSIDEPGWPQWRGPDRTGVSRDTGLAEVWPEAGPPLVWTATNVGSGFSSVAISQGKMFTLGRRADGEYIVAYDNQTGRELWARRSGPRYNNNKGGGPRSTPTVDGDRLYALGASGDLWCVEAADGETVWHVNFLEEYGGENIKWGLSESPLVDDDHVYVITGNPAGSILALDKQSGEIVWRSTELTDLPGYASAVMTEVGGVRQIVHFTDSATVGVRADDGELLWRYEKASNDSANCATPVVSDAHVFVTSAYDTGAALLRLSSEGSKTRAEEVYFTRGMQNHHGGVVLVDGYIYGFSDSILTCLDFSTGQLKWRNRSVGKGSLSAADGKLYVLGEKGTVALIQASPVSYRELSRFSFERKSSKTWAHPVVVDGRLYIRNRDEIYCYDVSLAGDVNQTAG